jgi:CBS domain-containing protein
MNVSDVMTHNVITLMPGHSVKHAAQIMLDYEVSGVPVVDAGALVGIITEGDLMRRTEFGLPRSGVQSRVTTTAAAGSARDFVKSHSWRVGDVMSRPVVTVSEDTPLDDVAILLGTRGIKRLPVLRSGELVGVVSRSDLLKIIAGSAPEGVAAGDAAFGIAASARLRDAGPIFAITPTVTVEHGVVHVWGQIRSEAERDAARVAIESIQGIGGIEDHLTVV